MSEKLKQAMPKTVVIHTYSVQVRRHYDCTIEEAREMAEGEDNHSRGRVGKIIHALLQNDTDIGPDINVLEIESKVKIDTFD